MANISQENILSNVAYVIKRITELWGRNPGKKTLQKIVFLIEEKDISLGYEYGLHFYGPYSAGLDATTTFLSADGIIEFNYSGQSHLMCVNEEHYNISSDGLSSEKIRSIDDLLERFKDYSPSQLELLSTAIYAYNNLPEKSRESVIGGVKKIKGSKYTEQEIEKALKEFSYFSKEFA